AYVNGYAAGTKTLEGRGNGLTSGSGYQNDLRAAERLESYCGISRVAVDIVVRTEFLSQFRRPGATSNRRHFESHLPSVLHTEMAKAADAEHSYKITSFRWRVSQCVERRKPCA